MEEEDELVEKAKKVRYLDERCPICGSRIDEKGFCACGASGG